MGPTGWEAVGVGTCACPAHTAQRLCPTTRASGPPDASLWSCRVPKRTAPRGRHVPRTRPAVVGVTWRAQTALTLQVPSGARLHAPRCPPRVPINCHSRKAPPTVSNRQPAGSGLNSRFISYTVSAGGRPLETRAWQLHEVWSGPGVPGTIRTASRGPQSQQTSHLTLHRPGLSPRLSGSAMALWRDPVSWGRARLHLQDAGPLPTMERARPANEGGHG